MPVAPCSWGDLIDRITILTIKSRHARGAALCNVSRELKQLTIVALSSDKRWSGSLLDMWRNLERVNTVLWDAENLIRSLPDGERYTATSRLIHSENDRRAALKRRLNEALQSDIIEEKLHTQLEAVP